MKTMKFGFAFAFSALCCISASAIAAYAENPTYRWTGNAGPLTTGDFSGYHSWSDPNNWDEGGVPPTGNPGTTQCNLLDFSAAAANTKIAVDNTTEMHLGGMTFAEDQGTLKIVPTSANASHIKTMSSGTITVPSGTRVEFGLACKSNNDNPNAAINVVGSGTFAFTATGAFSANRWNINVQDSTTLELNAPSADFNTLRIGLTQNAHLSLGCDTAIGALRFADNAPTPCGTIRLNGHSLSLTGGNNENTANNFNRLCDIIGNGTVVVSGGNVSTNKVAETFTGTLRMRNADIVSEAAYTGLTELAVDGSGRLTVADSQTVAALSGEGTTGGVVIEPGKTLTVDTSTNTTYAATLSGGGMFVKDGGGKLTLTGRNSLTGSMMVKSGTLAVVGTPANTDSATLAHRFTFDTVADGAFVDLADTKSTATFAYSVTGGGNDSATPDTGATASEICEGRRGANGIQLHAGSRAAVTVETDGSIGNAISTGTGPFTMSVWMKLDEAGCRATTYNYGTHAIFYLGSGGNSALTSFKVYVSSGTNLNFSAGGYKAGEAGVNYPSQGFTVPLTAERLFDGSWHMLAVTYSGEETHTIAGYYDGQKLGELTLSGDDRVNLASGRCHLGWGGMGSIAGTFDDWSLNTRCKTAEEIASEFNGEVTSGADAFAALPAPVAHWAFDDADNPGKDSSGNGYHLTADESIRTATPIVAAEGAYGKALAASNAYRWAEADWPENVPSGNAAWTLSVRCALSELKEGGPYTEPCAFYFGEIRNPDFSNFNDNQNRFLLVQYDNANYRANRLALHWMTPAYKAPNCILSDEAHQPCFTPANWVHLVVVHTPGTGFAIYRDGILSRSERCAAFNLTAKDLFVGLRPQIGNESNGYPYFPGFIDDIAIWDTTLSADQVRAYTAGLADGCVGSPLSSNADVTVEASATLEISGTRLAVKSLNGGGDVNISENASLAVDGGNITGKLSGLGQLTLSGKFAAADASAYYGAVTLGNGGSFVADSMTAPMSIPEGYCAMIGADGDGLPLAQTGGAVAVPSAASLTFPEIPETNSQYVVVMAQSFKLPESLDGWEISLPRPGRAMLKASNDVLTLSVKPYRGTVVSFR